MNYFIYGANSVASYVQTCYDQQNGNSMLFTSMDETNEHGIEDIFALDQYARNDKKYKYE